MLVNEIISDAEKKLVECVNSSNMIGVKAAQMMLSQAETQQKEIEKEESEINELRKSKDHNAGKITNFF